MSASLPLLTARALTIGYSNRNQAPKPVAESLDLDLWPGQLVCLLGPNGAGKSTLMRTLAGLQPPLAGQIMLAGQRLNQLTPVDLAKKMSLVLTERLEVGNLTAYELVALGRTPYTGWLGTLTPTDTTKIHEAMTATDTAIYARRPWQQLSDGERQKVMLARALAQDTDVILLDEPTAHLDLPNRVEMMHLLHQLARQTGKAILLSTHELDLALQAADQLWLLRSDGNMDTGVPEDLVLQGAFEAAFAKSGFHFDPATGTFTLHTDEAKGPVIQVRGSGRGVFWTRRALQREGYRLSQTIDAFCVVDITETSNGFSWTVYPNGVPQRYATLADLLAALQTLKRS